MHSKPMSSRCCGFTLSSTSAGTTMGLKERECGQMGVIMMAGTFGWIIDAPAATAYAVLPVGVDTTTPGKENKKNITKKNLLFFRNAHH